MIKNYKFLFILLFGLFIFIPKDTYAMTPSKLIIYASDYSVLDSCETGNCTYAANDTGRPSRFRFTIPSTIYTGYTYRVRAKFTIITDSSYNITFNDPQMRVDGTAQTLSINKWTATSNNVSNMMRTKVWELDYNFTSKNTSVGHHYPPFIEFSLKSGDVPSGTNYQVIWEFEDVDIVATSDNTGSVIQNSTQEIIDNDNKNTDKIVESQDKINDSLNDSDVGGAGVDASGFFSDFESDDFGLSDIVTMPLSFIQSLTSSSCYSLNVPLPFVDTNITLPCMTTIYEKYFGSFLVIYQIITTGYIAYYVCINIYRLVNDFKSPEIDAIEVMEL